MARASADFGRANRSLAAITAAADGDEFAIVGGGRVDISWSKIVGGSGSFSALDCSLQGSIDGTNWTTLDNTTSTSTEGMRSVVAECPLYVRVKGTTLTAASGTPTVTSDIIIRKSR